MSPTNSIDFFRDIVNDAGYTNCTPGWRHSFWANEMSLQTRGTFSAPSGHLSGRMAQI
jgi:hypothetical protein